MAPFITNVSTLLEASSGTGHPEPNSVLVLDEPATP